MIPVVIDTNVVVSANLVDAGPSAAIFRLAVNKNIIEMCVSRTVLAEYEEVLRRPRLKLSSGRIEDAKTLTISAHDSDNRFYECAEAAEAEYLITGNAKDFRKDYGVTRIISPRDFVDVVLPPLLIRSMRTLR